MKKKLYKKVLAFADEAISSMYLERAGDYIILCYTDDSGMDRRIYYTSPKQMFEFMCLEVAWMTTRKFDLDAIERNEVLVHLKVSYEVNAR